jgi:hypothetical protein
MSDEKGFGIKWVSNDEIEPKSKMLLDIYFEILAMKRGEIKYDIKRLEEHKKWLEDIKENWATFIEDIDPLYVWDDRIQLSYTLQVLYQYLSIPFSKEQIDSELIEKEKGVEHEKT